MCKIDSLCCFTSYSQYLSSYIIDQWLTGRVIIGWFDCQSCISPAHLTFGQASRIDTTAALNILSEERNTKWFKGREYQKTILNEGLDNLHII